VLAAVIRAALAAVGGDRKARRDKAGGRRWEARERIFRPGISADQRADKQRLPLGEGAARGLNHPPPKNDLHRII
jgi:hypothetical protein